MSTTGRYCSVPASNARVKIANAFEAPVDDSGEAAFGVSGTQQLRTHHRRKRQRHNAGHDDCACQSECEFAEERAGQSTLNSDRRVDRRQRDGHRDDRADQFAGSVFRRLERRTCPIASGARRSPP